MSVPDLGIANGVSVPEGMTLETFTQLVVATQDAAAMLADPNVRASLLTSSLAWWEAQGPFIREELLAQCTDHDLVSAFTALQHQAATPVVAISDDQQAAANQSVTNAAAPKTVAELSGASHEDIKAAVAIGTDQKHVAGSPPEVPALPFDVNAAHPIDSHSENTVVTITSAPNGTMLGGYSVAHGQASGVPTGSFADGNSIAAGDPLTHLPLGSTIVVGVDGPTKMAISVPVNGELHVGFGANLNAAIASVWHVLVADVKKAEAWVEQEL